jgi:excisionase family DNA binding protein
VTTGIAYASPQPGLLRADDAAVRLGVSRRTLNRMIEDGEIAKVMHNGRLWVTEGEIDDYFARKEAEGAKDRAKRAAARRHRSWNK